MSHNKKPIFIDFEASSLSLHSYPIEVGVSIPWEDKLYYDALIHPAEHWQDWDQEACKIHNIPKDSLFSEGQDPFDIAMTLNELLAGKKVFCDGGSYDKMWNQRLFEVAGIQPMFKLLDIEYLLNEGQILVWNSFKARIIKEMKIPIHRAGNDVLILQEVYKQTLAYSKSKSLSRKQHGR